MSRYCNLCGAKIIKPFTGQQTCWPCKLDVANADYRIQREVDKLIGAGHTEMCAKAQIMNGETCTCGAQ